VEPVNEDGASKTALLLLVVILVAGIVTYVAFVNPALGVAIGVGVVVAAFVWQVLRNR
jgi:hypothetical protein